MAGVGQVAGAIGRGALGATKFTGKLAGRAGWEILKSLLNTKAISGDYEKVRTIITGKKRERRKNETELGIAIDNVANTIEETNQLIANLSQIQSTQNKMLTALIVAIDNLNMQQNNSIFDSILQSIGSFFGTNNKKPAGPKIHASAEEARKAGGGVYRDKSGKLQHAGVGADGKPTSRFLKGSEALAIENAVKQAETKTVEEAAKVAGKSAIKIGGEAIGKSLVKKIPLIGLGAGIIFGIGRALEGDFTGAGLEIASGLVSIVPFAGTAISAAIDVGIAARDLGAFDAVKVGSPQELASITGAKSDAKRDAVAVEKAEIEFNASDLIFNADEMTINADQMEVQDDNAAPKQAASDKDATQQENTPQSNSSLDKYTTTGNEPAAAGAPNMKGSSDVGGLRFAPGVDTRIQQGIAQKTKQIQSQFGDFLITSGYRDPGRNARAGGAKNSAHMRGNAVDVSFAGDVEKTNKFIEVASKAGVGGIGVYRPGHIHIDTESKRYWGPNYSHTSLPSWAQPAIQGHMSNHWPTKSYALGGPVGTTGPAIVGDSGFSGRASELVITSGGQIRSTGAGPHIESLNKGDTVIPNFTGNYNPSLPSGFSSPNSNYTSRIPMNKINTPYLPEIDMGDSYYSQYNVNNIAVQNNTNAMQNNIAMQQMHHNVQNDEDDYHEYNHDDSSIEELRRYFAYG